MGAGRAGSPGIRGRLTCCRRDKPRAFGPSAPASWVTWGSPGRAVQAHRADGNRLRAGRAARCAQSVCRPPGSPWGSAVAFSPCGLVVKWRKGLGAPEALQESRNGVSLGIGQPVAALFAARLPLALSVCGLAVGGWCLEQVSSAPVMFVPHGAPVSSDGRSDVSSDALGTVSSDAAASPTSAPCGLAGFASLRRLRPLRCAAA